MANREKIILIDADVVSHFITGGEIMKLPKIFPQKIQMLDKVYAELERFPGKKKQVENLINFRLINLVQFPEDNSEIKKEYLHIKKRMFKGDGEAACLAVVRHSKDILASSNLKDIASYCKLHSIDYLTTMDFLCEAMKNCVMTELECNNFIQKVKVAKSKLPVSNMQEYQC